MKQVIRRLMPTIVFLLPLGNAYAQSEKGFVGSLGLLGGYMDLSANVAFYARAEIPFPIDPELIVAESFSTKGDGGGGRLSMNELSWYLLGRYTITTSMPKLSPFLAAGAGMHFIYSFSSDKSALGDTSKAILLSKAHLFLGLDLNLGTNVFLTGQGRLTYPSDIILDSGYFGFGIRL